LASYNLVSSYVGRAFIAIRDNDIAAEVMGVNLTTINSSRLPSALFIPGFKEVSMPF
jgi:ABC-type branched-subunit amino acid transport system permease subunit